MLGIALAGSIPEVYDFNELILWCNDNFDKNQRIIQLQGGISYFLSPFGF